MIRFARTFFRLFRLAIILVPLLIAYRGYIFLRECFRTLAAPGTGVEFNYQARKGAVLHITAEAYSYLWSTGTLHIIRPKLRDTHGDLLASAASARVNGIKIGGNDPIDAAVRDVKAKLVRLQNGHFAFEEYLPEKTPQTQNRPYHVRIDDADLQYVDLSGKDRFSQRAVAELLNVEGRGEDWITYGRLALPGVGVADTSVQRYRNTGLVIALTSDRLYLGRVLTHFRTTPEGLTLEPLKKIYADTVVAYGPVRLFVPDNKPFTLASAVKVVGTNVVYDGTDRFRTASFDGLVTGDGASGTLGLDRGTSKAVFVGAMDWSKETRFAGNISAQLASKADIPPSLIKPIPANVRFFGTSGNGWLSFDPKAGFRYDGGLHAATLYVSGHRFDSVNGVMRAGNGLVRIQSATGVWQSSQLQGDLAYFPSTKELRGKVEGNGVQLASFARTANLKGVRGTANAQALLTGSIDAPLLALRASGTGSFKAPGARKAVVGDFTAAGSYLNGGLELTSVAIDTKTGTVAATGRANTKGTLALNVAARGVSLEAFNTLVGGSASFSGQVTGTLSNPTIAGRAQVVGLTYDKQQIPVVVADVVANKNLIQATSFQAARGAAQARGSLAYGLTNGTINGNFQALNLATSEFSDQVIGIVNVTGGKVGGTVKKPQLDANLETSGLLVADRPIGKGRATLSVRGDDFRLPHIRAEVANGFVTGSAVGKISTQRARIEVQGSKLALSDLAPELSKTASIEGTVSGSAVLGTQGVNVKYARANGTVADVRINETQVGGGTWKAAADPDSFSGAAQIGTLERYLDVSNVAVNRKQKTISADFTAYQIPLQDVYSAAQRYLPEPGSELEARLLRIEGVVDARATVSGALSEPNLNVNVLDFNNLLLEGKDLGRVTAQFTRTGPVWTVTQMNWDGPAGTLQSSGIIDENGQTRYEGDFHNLDLGLLSMVNDNLARVRGRAGIAFLVDGPTNDPTIRASLDASKTTVLTAAEQESTALEFGLVLDTVNISQSRRNADGSLAGGIEASGKLFYRGLEGNLSAHVPLKYPFNLPQGDPLLVALDLPERDIQSLVDYFPGIDPKRTKGSISGHVALGGVVGDAKLTGRVAAQASTFGIKKVQTSLSNVTAEATVDSDAVAVLASGTGSDGGTLAINARAPIGDVSERIKELTSRGAEAILDRTVTGELALTDFGLKYDAGEQGRILGKANAKLAMSGAARSPLISGDVLLSGVNTVLPSFETTPNAPIIYAVDPRFNVRLALVDAANVTTSLAKLKIAGDGALTGSLSAPAIRSDLVVLGGTVRLPTATVRVEPGGTLRLRYNTDPAGETLAALDVNLVGNTSLTALEYGDIPQHYDITLTIRGNLLDEGHTQILAESDPPGLSQDRILAMLGQADLIAALAGSVSKLEASRELRNALAGYAVPALLQPVTAAFAKGLGLDYLNVEYDPYSRVTLSFAKELNKQLTLQGRRQVSPPIPGYRPQFDLRLVYRLPFGGKALKRTAVSVGVDQDRPWKVGFEYGFRF
ncbi:MAG: translocation and assembly module TamB [Fimbriimonadaceae bacterium]|jgi:translocation and assembly module TamB|nr:translocation and assembly module TamB [Fimbriimonadaceae bacterium]